MLKIILNTFCLLSFVSCDKVPQKIEESVIEQCMGKQLPEACIAGLTNVEVLLEKYDPGKKLFDAAKAQCEQNHYPEQVEQINLCKDGVDLVDEAYRGEQEVPVMMQ